MCQKCSTGSDAQCSNCGATATTRGVTYEGGTRHQAGPRFTTDCADCGHTLDSAENRDDLPEWPSRETGAA